MYSDDYVNVPEPDDYFTEQEAQYIDWLYRVVMCQAAGPGYDHTTIPAKPEPIADDNDDDLPW